MDFGKPDQRKWDGRVEKADPKILRPPLFELKLGVGD
jgi:hypothetical protein